MNITKLKEVSSIVAAARSDLHEIRASVIPPVADAFLADALKRLQGAIDDIDDAIHAHRNHSTTKTNL